MGNGSSQIRYWNPRRSLVRGFDFMPDHYRPKRVMRLVFAKLQAHLLATPADQRFRAIQTAANLVGEGIGRVSADG
jgi:hypothetical protein